VEEHAGTVAGIGLRTGGTTVLQVAERAHGEVDDAPRGPTVQVHDEGDAAGVVLEPRVVEPDRAGQISAHHPRPRSRSREGPAGWVDRDGVGPTG
jgi:hypothetical protein